MRKPVVPVKPVRVAPPVKKPAPAKPQRPVPAKPKTGYIRRSIEEYKLPKETPAPPAPKKSPWISIKDCTNRATDTEAWVRVMDPDNVGYRVTLKVGSFSTTYDHTGTSGFGYYSPGEPKATCRFSLS